MVSQALSSKQSVLVSGTNLKTVNNVSLLGSGSINIDKNFVGLSEVDNTRDLDKPVSNITKNLLDSKQAKLISGQTIKTINNENLLASGNIVIDKVSLGLGNVENTADIDKAPSSAVLSLLDDKQQLLLSGHNLKTINNINLLSSGNLVIDKNFVGLGNVSNTADTDKPLSSAMTQALATKQNLLIPGTTLKTLNGANLLGNGDIVINKSTLGLNNVDNTSDSNKRNIFNTHLYIIFIFTYVII